jgi:hypothetical protein
LLCARAGRLIRLQALEALAFGRMREKVEPSAYLFLAKILHFFICGTPPFEGQDPHFKNSN